MVYGLFVVKDFYNRNNLQSSFSNLKDENTSAHPWIIKLCTNQLSLIRKIPQNVWRYFEIGSCIMHFLVFLFQIYRTNSNFSLSLMNVLGSTPSRKEFTLQSTWGSKTGILIEKGALSKKLLKEKKEGFGQVRDL